MVKLEFKRNRMVIERAVIFIYFPNNLKGRLRSISQYYLIKRLGGKFELKFQQFVVICFYSGQTE